MAEQVRKLTLAAVIAADGPIIASIALADPPAAVGEAIRRPTFEVAAQPLDAGTAFALDWDGPNARTLLISAHHLFGPAGAKPREPPWPRQVDG